MSINRAKHFLRIAQIFAYLDECEQIKNARPDEKSFAFVKALQLLEPEQCYDANNSAIKLKPNTYELSYYIKQLELDCMYPYGISENHDSTESDSPDGDYLESGKLDSLINSIVTRIKTEDQNDPAKMHTPVNADKIIDRYVMLELQNDSIMINRFINFINNILVTFDENANVRRINLDQVKNNEVQIKNEDYNRTSNQRIISISYLQPEKNFSFIYDFKKEELVAFCNDTKFIKAQKPNIEPDLNIVDYVKSDKSLPYCELPPLSKNLDKIIDCMQLSTLWKSGFHISLSKIQELDLNLASFEIGELIKYQDYHLAFEVMNEYLNNLSGNAPIAVLNLYNTIINEPLKRSEQHGREILKHLIDNDIDFEKIYESHWGDTKREGLYQIAKSKLNEIYNSNGYSLLQAVKMEISLVQAIDAFSHNDYIQSTSVEDVEMTLTL
ncbi:hypothetical protein OCF84_21080 (plasmid) [Shewanella xiamenensis]|uniref:Uncharacterized protein n=1 Tax=Shewanella xiamenensis TaxID=332186 RepID=A0ABT6UDT2_9GAMM|nr:hypothetical protein [Shewanella xiamenensis]MDI5832629.1 hypothetical protein [Shewanella xiamenensis]WHF58014.1 hypothetical protein OCF84_21080 [Shewanella xiamenensis]